MDGNTVKAQDNRLSDLHKKINRVMKRDQGASLDGGQRRPQGGDS